MRVCSLGSGSKGNATLVWNDTGFVLIDCGFGLKESIFRIEEKGLSISDLQAIFVSHEHGDHGKGVGMLARKADVPVYCSAGTYIALQERNILSGSDRVNIIEAESAVEIIGLRVLPVTVPHDARETFQFIFDNGSSRFGILTDAGSITEHMIEVYSECDYLLLEFNHDTQMLWDGPYPPGLKQRVAGDYGHLSNQQAVSFLERLSRFPEKLLVSHISEKNNSREAIETLLYTFFEEHQGRWFYSDQQTGFEWQECC